MFGFLKRKRAEKDWAKVGKAYASSVGDGIGDNLNEWFARVRHRDDHTLEGFRMRMAGLGHHNSLTLKEEASVELNAFIEHVNELRNEQKEQGELFMQPSLEIAESIDATKEIRELIDKRWSDEDFGFKQRIAIVYGNAIENLN